MQTKNSIFIYSNKYSNRLAYIAEVIFKEILGLETTIFSDKSLIIDEDIPLINYSNEDIKGAFQIIPNGLLFEKDIIGQGINLVWEDDLPWFFKVENKDVQYDVLSMCFYVITRYEEYLPFKADEHGRFISELSLAYQNNFLELPVVQLWAKYLGQKLHILYPLLKFREREFRILPSIDVDMAWAYKNKGLLRNLGGMLRDLTFFKYKDILNRLFVLVFNKKDPFYTFKKINNDCQNLVLKYFILYGELGQYDKNINIENQNFNYLISGLAKKYNIGIHPSYKSNESFDSLKKEIVCLEKLVGKIEISRQHFIKLTFPKTYQSLIFAGIRHDYSMGYPDKSGFRAGMAISFPWYNLRTNKSTDLHIHPFVTMDVTLRKYENLSVDNAIEKVIKLKEIVRSIGGDFTFIWHNSSLGTIDNWEEYILVWKELCSKE